jgi:hypothetical protein
MTIHKPYRTQQIGKTIANDQGQPVAKLKDYHWTDDQGWLWTVQTITGELISVTEEEIEFNDLH